MKRLCLLILAISLAAAAQDAKPNFSGAWELQLDKSSFGELPAAQGQTTVVDHKDRKLKMTITSKTPQGDRTGERDLTTDGKEHENKVGENTWKTKTEWVEEELHTEASIEVQGHKIQMKDRWQLSDDGKTWTVHRTLVSEMGQANLKLVYAKQ